MRKPQFEGIALNLLPRLPGYSVHGWLLHHSPDDGILRGFCCDHSGVDPDCFALVAFALPLFMPLPGGLHLNFGRRLRDEDGRELRWNRLDSNLETSLLCAILKADAIYFQPHMTKPNPANQLRSLGDPTDPYLAEAIAFCHARVGNRFAALQSIRSLAGSLDPSIPWHNAMATRLATLDALLETNPAELVSRTEQWIQSNYHDLGLDSPETRLHRHG